MPKLNPNYTLILLDRLPALSAGLIFVSGALALLLSDLILAEKAFGLSHFVTLCIFLGTLLVVKLCIKAKHERAWLTFFGYLLVAIAGTGLIIFKSTGRQAAEIHLTEAEITDALTRKPKVIAELEAAKAIRNKTATALHNDCVEGKRSKAHCDGVRASLAVYEAAVKGHEADLDKLKISNKIADPAAHNLSNILHMAFSLDRKKVEALATPVSLILTTILFEFGSIIALNHAFRPLSLSKAPVPAFSKPSTLALPKPSTTPLSKTPANLIPTGKRNEVITYIQQTLARGEPFPSRRHLMLKFNCAESSLSEWIKHAKARGDL